MFEFNTVVAGLAPSPETLLQAVGSFHCGLYLSRSFSGCSCSLCDTNVSPLSLSGQASRANAYISLFPVLLEQGAWDETKPFIRSTCIRGGDAEID